VAAEAAARSEEAAKDEGWMMSKQEVRGTEESDRRRIQSPCVEAGTCSFLLSMRSMILYKNYKVFLTPF